MKRIGELIMQVELAPEIVEALMNGRQGVELTAEKMRQILPIPCSWREQRHQLNL